MKMKLLAGVSLVATLGMGAAAHAQDAASVQAQLDAMRAEIADLKAQLAAKPVVTAPEAAGYAAPPSALPAPKPEQITEKFDGAVRWVDGLGDSFKVRGRMLLDAVDEHVDRRGSPTRTNYDSFKVRPRQLYLGVEGNIGKQWSYKLEGGARNGGTWSWDDAILAYNLNKPTRSSSATRRPCLWKGSPPPASPSSSIAAPTSTCCRSTTRWASAGCARVRTTRSRARCWASRSTPPT